MPLDYFPTPLYLFFYHTELYKQLEDKSHLFIFSSSIIYLTQLPEAPAKSKSWVSECHTSREAIPLMKSLKKIKLSGRDKGKEWEIMQPAEDLILAAQ